MPEETKYGALPEDTAKTAAGRPGGWNPRQAPPPPKTAEDVMAEREKIARKQQEGGSA